MKNTFYVIFLIVSCTVLAGCSRANENRDIYVAVDVSGSYIQYSARSLLRLSEIVRDFRPGDHLSIAQIEDCSFTDESLLLSRRLDRNELIALDQIPYLMNEIKQISEDLKSSAYTDISGAIYRASDYFRFSGAGQKILIVFSDLKEELAPKCSTNGTLDFHLRGVHVILADVSILEADTQNPLVYEERIDRWTSRLTEAGAIMVWQARGVTQVRQILEGLRLDPPVG